MCAQAKLTLVSSPLLGWMVTVLHADMPPEYMYEGLISPKTDAYAFGVCLLELITGKEARTPKLQEQVASCVQGRGRRMSTVLDEKVADQWDDDDARAMAKIAISLLADEPADRMAVLDALPELEAILRRVVARTVAPAGMQYDPETGELITERGV